MPSVQLLADGKPSRQVGLGPNVQQYDAFLAYNSKDREEAIRIHEHLGLRGLKIWID